MHGFFNFQLETSGSRVKDFLNKGSDNFQSLSSAYDMKNIFCLFERPFKIQKNGVFLFEISFFVLEILTFFYYAN